MVLAFIVEAGARFYLWENWPSQMAERAGLSPNIGYYDKGLGDQQPNINSVAIEFRHSPYHIVTNAEGFNSAFEYSESKRTILAVGSSYTYGSYVHTLHSYPSWLQSHLNQKFGLDQDYQVMNAGFPGYSHASILNYLEEKGLKTNPEIVLIQLVLGDIYSNNDDFENVIEGKGFDFFRRNQQGRETFDSLKRALKNYSAVYSIMSRIKSYYRQKQAEEQLKKLQELPDKLNPKTGVQRQVVYSPEAPESVHSWTLLEALFVKYKTLIEGSGAVPVFVLWPEGAQVMDRDYPNTPQDKFRELAKAAGVHLVDLLPEMRKAGPYEALALRRYPVSKDDLKLSEQNLQFPKEHKSTLAGVGHYARYGNFVIAKAIMDYLLSENLLDNTPSNQPVSY